MARVSPNYDAQNGTVEIVFRNCEVRQQGDDAVMRIRDVALHDMSAFAQTIRGEFDLSHAQGIEIAEYVSDMMLMNELRQRRVHVA